MRYEIEEISPVVRKITFEIPSEEVASKIESEYKDIQPQVRMRGFRPGRVPIRVLKRNPRYRKYISERVAHLFQEMGIKEVYADQPNKYLMPFDTEELQGIEENKPYKFSISFEVRPEIKLPELSELEVPYEAIEITDEDIEKELAKLREKHAILKPVEDREVRAEDRVDVYFKIGSTEGEAKPQEGEELQRDQVIVGDLSLPKELNLNIVGMKPGEEKVFPYQLKAKEEGEEPQTRYMWIKVIQINEKVLPELEEVAQAENYDNLEALKDSIKKELEEKEREISKQRFLDKVYQKLMETVEIPLPENLFQQHYRNKLTQIIQLMAYLGNESDFINSLRDKLKSEAEFDIKKEFILYQIIDDNDIQATEEEFQAELKKQAKEKGFSVEYLKSKLREDEIEDLYEKIKKRKAEEFLYENVKKAEEKLTRSEREKRIEEEREKEYREESKPKEQDSSEEKPREELSPEELEKILSAPPPLAKPQPELLKEKESSK